LSATGIYLDEDFSKALITAGYIEGLIPSATGSSEYVKDFVSKYSGKQEYKQIALEKIVLHEKVFLYPYFDDFMVDNLINEGIADLPDLGPFFDPNSGFSYAEAENSGILYPTLALLQTEGYAITSDELIRILKTGVLENYRDLSYEQIALYSDKLLGEWSRAKEKRFRSGEEILTKLRPVHDALIRVSKLIKASRLLGVQALWNCIIAPNDRNGYHPSADYYSVAGVYFRGLKGIRVKTLHEAIDLRKNPHIQELRAEITEMTDLLKRGQLSEADVMKRIDNANNILEALDIAGKAGTIITILGLPTLAWQALGTLLAAADVSLLAAEHAAKQNWNWALVSNVSTGKS